METTLAEARADLPSLCRYLAARKRDGTLPIVFMLLRDAEHAAVRDYAIRWVAQSAEFDGLMREYVGRRRLSVTQLRAIVRGLRTPERRWSHSGSSARLMSVAQAGLRILGRERNLYRSSGVLDHLAAGLPGPGRRPVWIGLSAANLVLSFLTLGIDAHTHPIQPVHGTRLHTAPASEDEPASKRAR